MARQSVAAPVKTRLANTATLPAPLGGWNTRDPWARMPPNDAIALDDFICRTNYVELRKGQTQFANSPSSSVVKSLYTYRGSLNQKMLAGTDAGIYDISSGAFGSAAIARSNGYNWFVNLNTAGGYYLVTGNGVDAEYHFDGTSWAANSNSGVAGPFTSGKLLHQRIFMTKAGSTSFFYYGLNSIQGAVSEYPMGTIFNKGGQLIAIEAWTLDAGQGITDFTVMVTDQGQVAVWQGYDPTNASTWNLVGVFDLAIPMGGAKCLLKYGGDVLLMCQDGIWNMSKGLLSSSIDRDVSISNKIQSQFLYAYANYASFKGWDMLLYSPEGILMFNIPTSNDGTSAHQYVMNTITKAWSRFTGFPATCFTVFNGLFYFGTAGGVRQGLTTYADLGTNDIIGKAATAYNYFKSPGAEKQLTMMRPTFQFGLPVNTQMGISPDFTTSPYYSPSTGSSGNQALWDTGVWDTDLWAFDVVVNSDWNSVTAYPGYCFSTLLQVATQKTGFSWISTDYLYTAGGPL